VIVGVVAASLAMPVSAAAAATPPPKTYRNCKLLNARYPHGVGRPAARDRVAAGTEPVTTFLRNRRLYDANRGRDRDRDGIACEQP
jgi:hypothetical protein